VFNEVLLPNLCNQRDLGALFLTSKHFSGPLPTTAQSELGILRQPFLWRQAHTKLELTDRMLWNPRSMLDRIEWLHYEMHYQNMVPQLICSQLLLPHLSQVRSLRLHVHFSDHVLEQMAEGLGAMQQITSLYLDGGGETLRRRRICGWVRPTLQRAIGTLQNLRELGFCFGTHGTGSFSQAIQYIDTLHITSRGPKVPRLNFVAPRVRVLTLASFDDLTFCQLRAILKAFPGLQRLCFRFCRPKQGAKVWKPRVLADPAFAGREAGWLDKIDFDEDMFTTVLYRFDEGTGALVRSTWDLHGVYLRWA